MTAICAPVFAEVLDKVIVVVNDEVITQREFDRAFVPIKSNYEANLQGKELETRLEEAKKGLMEQIINTKLAVSIARSNGVEVNEAQLEERVAKIKAYYGSEEEFLMALNSGGTNLTEFKKEMEDQLIAQEVVNNEVAARIVITPSEISELYEKNQDKLITPDQIKIRGILVKKNPGDEDGAAEKKIKAIYGRLKAGEDFETVAREQSEGPYADNGGDMGFVSKGQLLPEMDEVIFKTAKGDVSEIAESEIGSHIFYVEEIQPTRSLELEEVSDFLRSQLYKKKFEENLMEWLDEKREDAYIAYK